MSSAILHGGRGGELAVPPGGGIAMALTYTLAQAPNVYFLFTQFYLSIALWLAIWYVMRRGEYIGKVMCLGHSPHQRACPASR